MMSKRRYRRDVTALVLAMAVVMAFVGGCVPGEGAGLETFFRDLALQTAAAFLL
ncbi:MAG TPA: hypothetical protein VM243_06295 [Phycisphaerae bacterium]|nr:hypothetical protein [Phycisphaerae bacterium]